MCTHEFLYQDFFPTDYIPRFQAIDHDNKFFVNPGTATGAWAGTFNGYGHVLVPDGLRLTCDIQRLQFHLLR